VWDVERLLVEGRRRAPIIEYDSGGNLLAALCEGFLRCMRTASTITPASRTSGLEK